MTVIKYTCTQSFIYMISYCLDLELWVLLLNLDRLVHTIIVHTFLLTFFTDRRVTLIYHQIFLIVLSLIIPVIRGLLNDTFALQTNRQTTSY